MFIDANGNYRVIGTTTTNAQGTFGFNWTPDIPGAYTVTATFAGTGAYYGSSATAYFDATLPSTPAPTVAPASGIGNNVGPNYWDRCCSNRYNHRNRHSRLTHNKKKALVIKTKQ